MMNNYVVLKVKPSARNFLWRMLHDSSARYTVDHNWLGDFEEIIEWGLVVVGINLETREDVLMLTELGKKCITDHNSIHIPIE